MNMGEQDISNTE